MSSVADYSSYSVAAGERPASSSKFNNFKNAVQNDVTALEAGVAAVQPNPPGVLLPYAGAAAPTGYLLCDGAAVSRTTYAALFAAIGTGYGVGDGSTTFNLPDGKGRTIVGKGSNTVVDTLGKSDGVAEANRRGTLHRHTPHSHTGGFNAAADVTDAGTGVLVATAVSNTGAADGGSGVATDPLDGGGFLVANWIIKV